LCHFSKRYGSRFDPCEELVGRAESGRTFHDGEPDPRSAPSIVYKLAG
jgi:hypothetical protein